MDVSQEHVYFKNDYITYYSALCVVDLYFAVVVLCNNGVIIKS